MTTKALCIDLIKDSSETQGRAGIDDDHVADLKAAWLAKADIPPVVVYFDGTDYWLADGFHRIAGARLAKRSSIPCEIRNGTKRDAWLAALAANKSHGLRRTNTDKRRCVTLALNDDELVKWSDNRIADHIGLSVQFVGNMRRELSTVESSPAARSKDEPKVGKDGKARKPPTKPNKPASTSGSKPTLAEGPPKSLPTVGTVNQAEPGEQGVGGAGECTPGTHVWSDDEDEEYCKTCKVSRVDVEPTATIPGGVTFPVETIEKVQQQDQKVSEMFKSLLEHVRLSIGLVDQINNATNRKHGSTHEACVNHLDVLSQDLHKWRKACK